MALAQNAVGALIDAGVQRDIAQAAVDAARNGKLADAFVELNLPSEGPQRVLEYVTPQSLTMGPTSPRHTRLPC